MKHARKDYERIADLAALADKHGLPRGKTKDWGDGFVSLADGRDIYIGECEHPDLDSGIGAFLSEALNLAGSLPEGAKPIPDDEPVFLIRGQDPCGARAVRGWAMLARIGGAKNNIVDAAMALADRMADWATEHRHGSPDMPEEKD